MDYDTYARLILTEKPNKKGRTAKLNQLDNGFDLVIMGGVRWLHLAGSPVKEGLEVSNHNPNWAPKLLMCLCP